MAQDLLREKNLNNPVPRTYKRANPDAVRLLVFDLLTEVNRSDGYSNLLLPQALTDSKFDDRDKAFATELLYGTIRMQGRHDWILAQVSNRPWEDVDPGVIDVGRMALQQIHQMRVPDHAAVSASVDIARKRLGEAQGSFLNALLRAVLKKSLSEWLLPIAELSDPIERLAIEHSHPQWIVSAYFDLLKNENEVSKALIANNHPALPTLVAWPGRSTQSELLELGGVATLFSPYGVRAAGSPGAVAAVRERRAGVQDEGSQLVAKIFADLSAQRKSWLDLCAGPGGKAALLSSIASFGDHIFTANEISQPRAKLVSQVVQFGEVIVGDGRDIATNGLFYDAIIADLPCTGLGALRRRPEVRWRRTLADLRTLTDLQLELSEAALSVLNPGGYFAYVTCSPHLAETKFQISTILKKHPELRALDLRPYFPEGLVSATDDGSLLLWPQTHNTDAMFMAVFEKVS
jgi:16S rRNA (cytosine967-C5)-methyltransferase